ncbi:MAG: recombinase family protein [Clostridia bacterium]|nr:recombinase family protein [Clostridia bacterium]
MNKSKVAIYSCYLTMPKEQEEIYKKHIADIKKDIEKNPCAELIGEFVDICPRNTPLEKRPVLLKLLELSKDDNLNEIAIPSLKHIGRNMDAMMNIVQAFDKQRVGLKFYAECINTASPQMMSNLKRVCGIVTGTEPIIKEKKKNVVMYYAYPFCKPEKEQKHRESIEICKSKLVENKNVNLVDCVIDIGGGNKPITERIGFKELMQICNKKDIDEIYTYSIETLAPKTKDFISCCKMFEEKGIGIKFIETDLEMDYDVRTDNYIMTL